MLSTYLGLKIITKSSTTTLLFFLLYLLFFLSISLLPPLLCFFTIFLALSHASIQKRIFCRPLSILAISPCSTTTLPLFPPSCSLPLSPFTLLHTSMDGRKKFFHCKRIFFFCNIWPCFLLVTPLLLSPYFSSPSPSLISFLLFFSIFLSTSCKITYLPFRNFLVWREKSSLSLPPLHFHLLSIIVFLFRDVISSSATSFSPIHLPRTWMHKEVLLLLYFSFFNLSLMSHSSLLSPLSNSRTSEGNCLLCDGDSLCCARKTLSHLLSLSSIFPLSLFLLIFRFNHLCSTKIEVADEERETHHILDCSKFKDQYPMILMKFLSENL